MQKKLPPSTAAFHKTTAEKANQIQSSIKEHLKSELGDIKIDYLIYSTRMVFTHRSHGGAFSHILDKNIRQLKEVSSVTKILEFFFNEHISYYNIAETIEYCISLFVTWFNNGNDEIYEIVFSLLILSFKNHSSYTDNVKSFFINTDTVFRAYNDILKIDDLPYLEILFDDFLDEKSEADYTNRYLNNEITSTDYIRYVRRLERSSERFIKLADIIKDKEGYTIKQKADNYKSELKMQAEQIYFDSLLDADCYNNLVDSVFEEYIADDRTIEDIIEECSMYVSDSKQISVNYYLKKKIIFDLTNYQSWRINRFLKYKKTEVFLFSLIVSRIKKSDTLTVPKKHKEFIVDICNTLLNDNSLYESIEYNYSGCTIPCYWIDFAYIIDRLNIVFDEKYLPFILYIPDGFYNDKEYYDGFANYIIRNYQQSVIQTSVRYNIENVQLLSDVAVSHINYCKNHHLDYAIDLSSQLLQDKNNRESIKRSCIDYLLGIWGEEKTISMLLPSEDITVYEIISDKVINRYGLIEERLISYCECHPDDYSQWIRLFKYNSKYILNKYISYCKKNNSIPDYSNTNNVSSITESMECINDISLLNMLLELIEVIHNNGFKDNKYFGISNVLYKILRNLFNTDYELVSSELNSMIDKHKENIDIRRYCNNLLYDGEMMNNQKSDITYTIDEIKEMIRK